MSNDPAHRLNLPAHELSASAVQESRDLFDELVALRDGVIRNGNARYAALKPEVGTARVAGSVLNLCHYLALRHQDLRPLQRRLMRHGLSSLGRIEGRVLAGIDAVLATVAVLAKRKTDVRRPSERAFFRGEQRLNEATAALLGPAPADRRGRIMVTLASEAATDPAHVAALVESGMDVARINCAHDGPEAWAAMAGHVRAAAAASGRRVPIVMDIAGPKIRTEAVAVHGKHARLAPGVDLVLLAEGEPLASKHRPFVAVASLPDIVNRLRVGDRVRYDDGQVEGRVASVSPGEAVIRVTQSKTDGVKLKPEKGLNLPDTVLGLSPLTAKDETDLGAVIALADIVGYSFVSKPEDLDLLDRLLRERAPEGKSLGLIAKIELPEAIGNLPALMARAAGRRPFGIMIARGDLAAEIGFERLAEMQEELLWLCEAAHVPAIWATQVLEGLVKDGVPSRGEMTDAAMAARAECVMLNKGPNITTAIEWLDRLMGRMDANVYKKTAMMRELGSW